MLFARAMSKGVKWYCADVFGGPIYTPEEMGAKVDEDGDVVEMPAVAPASRPVEIAQPPADEPAPIVTSKYWRAWYAACADAEAGGITVPIMDDAASDADLMAAGKNLRKQINAAKAEAQPA